MNVEPSAHTTTFTCSSPPNAETTSPYRGYLFYKFATRRAVVLLPGVLEMIREVPGVFKLVQGVEHAVNTGVAQETALGPKSASSREPSAKEPQLSGSFVSRPSFAI
jgi:hypothetical protein